MTFLSTLAGVVASISNKSATPCNERQSIYKCIHITTVKTYGVFKKKYYLFLSKYVCQAKDAYQNRYVVSDAKGMYMWTSPACELRSTYICYNVQQFFYMLSAKQLSF